MYYTAEMTDYTKKATAYLRTSSATNVGAEKDSDKRQREAIRVYAAANKIEVAKEFYDAGVSGVLPVEEREQFSEMVQYMKRTGIGIILVENIGRFARDQRAQLNGYDDLKKNGFELIPVDMPDFFTNESPTNRFLRGIMMLYAVMEKESLVEKMKVARDRKRKENGKCEGKLRAPHEAVALAKKLKEDGLSLRNISAELEKAGFTVMQKKGDTGKPYTAASIKYMIENFGEENP